MCNARKFLDVRPFREYLSPGGEAVSAGFENGDDECFYDKSELPANGDGGWVKDVGSCARGGAG